MLPVRHASSRRPRPRARLAAAGLAVVALVAGALTGCGGDDAGEPDVAPAPPAAVTVDPDAVMDGDDRFAPSPTPQEGTEAAPPEEPAEEPTEEPAEEPADAPEEGAEAAPEEPAVDCTTLQAAWNQTNQALVNLSADHPRALVSSFRSAAESMAGVEEVPDAITEPWATMSGYLKRVNDAFEDVDAGDANAVAAAMAAAVTAADTQAATTAGQEITAFVSAGCVG